MRVITILLVIGVYCTFTDRVSCTTSQADVNRLIDSLLVDLVERSKEDIDPLTLPNLGSTFDRPIRGRAVFKDICLHGLSQVARTGNVIYTTTASRSKCVNVTLIVPKLTIDLKGELTLAGFGPKSPLAGSIEGVKVMAVFEKEESEQEFELNQFAMVEVGYLDLKVKGSPGFINTLSNLLIRVTKSSLSGVVSGAVEFALSRMAQDMTVNMGGVHRMLSELD